MPLGAHELAQFTGVLTGGSFGSCTPFYPQARKQKRAHQGQLALPMPWVKHAFIDPTV